MICELKDPSRAAPLFEGRKELDVGIVACLENVMGRILANDPEKPKSALALIGDFAFCAGEPDLALLCGKPDRWMLVMPQDDAWASMIENNFPAEKRIRYAMKKSAEFDREKLKAKVTALPGEYTLRRFDGELYDLCLKDGPFRECVSAFGSKEKYLELGRGYAVMKDGRIVSAASSYSRYREGIDIEIDTVKEERRKGLGYAVAAKLILSCLDEGLFPSWDAANKLSVRMAEKLGYVFSHEYFCYGLD